MGTNNSVCVCVLSCWLHIRFLQHVKLFAKFTLLFKKDLLSQLERFAYATHYML